MIFVARIVDTPLRCVLHLRKKMPDYSQIVQFAMQWKRSRC